MHVPFKEFKKYSHLLRVQATEKRVKNVSSDESFGTKQRYLHNNRDSIKKYLTIA